MLQRKAGNSGLSSTSGHSTADDHPPLLGSTRLLAASSLAKFRVSSHLASSYVHSPLRLHEEQRRREDVSTGPSLVTPDRSLSAIFDHNTAQVGRFCMFRHPCEESFPSLRRTQLSDLLPRLGKNSFIKMMLFL
ncbi:hypothetical protein D4764_02G0011900 [Takifugu flavidus]|uniref:Uncharacterized protein n=1 Tax=Takifugu flavidus TaxID=433684 RepID=A0A5C6NNC5_9TELE|nr:hypothetical protein D4764_02G0011900 [Takifugu flavidus]